MRNKSNMQHRFSDVPSINIERSRFKRDHKYKTTFDAGYLVPILVDEALPGDTYNVNVNGFARLSTPTFPIMDNMFMDTFFFSVPMRIVYENWQKLMGEREDPDDSIDYTVPIINSDAAGYENESIYDYMGLPTKVTASYEHRADFLRAYNKIWNDWFRDENLQDSVTNNKDDGPDAHTDYELLKRGKRHDYFTSCLPWLQKGDAVEMSLGDTAPVMGIDENIYVNNGSANKTLTTVGGNTVLNTNTAWAGSAYARWGEVAAPENTGLEADLSSAVGPTINELRQAIQVQSILELDARSGTRYTEILQSHFKVTSDDGRLQRPEYLGGGTTPIHINPIARTDSSPGVLGAMGVANFNNHGFVKSFTEHCIIIGLVNVRADLTYQEGIERMWNRQTRLDFYWPLLAHLGEQAVLNKEIYIDATTIGSGVSEEVFGYQERFGEMRYKPSKITGKFRSNDTGSLDAWHLGIELGSTPTLDDTFIEDNPPVDRCIAVPTEPHFIFDSYIQMDCTRPMPTYAIPGFVTHF